MKRFGLAIRKLRNLSSVSVAFLLFLRSLPVPLTTPSTGSLTILFRRVTTSRRSVHLARMNAEKESGIVSSFSWIGVLRIIFCESGRSAILILNRLIFLVKTTPKDCLAR